MINKDIKVVVGMSGGVDSSLAAVLLKEQGYQVTGVYLDLWDKQKDDQNKKMAARICKQIDIPLQILNFKKQYQKQVLNQIDKEFRKGRIPNPCVICNQKIKFGLFLDWAVKNGFDYIATGHYARLKFVNNISLLQAKDKEKDQTYFLSHLNQKQLERIIFPIGNLNKNKVRKEAKKRGLPVWNRKSSHNFCIVKNKQKFRDFLKRKIREHQGEVRNLRGEIIGSHQGVEFYTIGQRHNFTVYSRISKTKPRYVIDKKIRENQLVAGFKKDLRREQFEIENLHLINTKYEILGRKLKCRIRHRGELIHCQIGKKERGKYIVKLNTNVIGVSPGQICVFYHGNECWGCGELT